jgi:diguanylate cyclase (GGDEF)-like protein
VRTPHAFANKIVASPGAVSPARAAAGRAGGGGTAGMPRNGAIAGPSRTLLDALAEEIGRSALVVDATGRIAAVLGRSPLGPGCIGTRLFDHCHPADVPRMLDLAVVALRSEPGWRGEIAVRVRSDRGGWHDVALSVRNRLDDPDIRGFAVVLDTTAGGLGGGAGPGGAARTPRRAEPELELLASAIPLPILVLEPDGTASFVNDAARSLCARLLVPLATTGLAGIVDPADQPAVEETLDSLRRAGGERTMSLRLLAPRPGAEERVVDATFRARTRRGEVAAIVVSLVDVTVHRARESELRRMASCDPLTGLLNRTEVEEVLAERLLAAPERVALLYVDLDGFKAVNDTHGHDVGDELLVQIAQILDAKTRPDDVVGRLGGDEFAVVTDSPDPTDAHGLACRIAVAIAELSASRRLPVSASVGAATAQAGDTPRDLLRRADSAMYDEKRRRRALVPSAR